jgi:hypothetical protein
LSANGGVVRGARTKARTSPLDGYAIPFTPAGIERTKYPYNQIVPPTPDLDRRIAAAKAEWDAGIAWGQASSRVSALLHNLSTDELLVVGDFIESAAWRERKNSVSSEGGA